jgi:hypothetical protein
MYYTLKCIRPIITRYLHKLHVVGLTHSEKVVSPYPMHISSTKQLMNFDEVSKGVLKYKARHCLIHICILHRRN